MDHISKHPYCHACQVGKLQPQQSRRSKGLGPPPSCFGEQITADHILSRSDRSEGITGELDALLIYDRGTTWIDCYPVKTQGAHDVYTKFLSFIGPLQKVQYVHTDDSRALKAALDELKVSHDSSTPGRPKTNGVAERQVKEVIHGVRTLLRQAGLPHSFWTYAMRNFCFSRNVKIRKSTNPSAHHRRFG